MSAAELIVSLIIAASLRNGWRGGDLERVRCKADLYFGWIDDAGVTSPSHYPGPHGFRWLP